ncbi:MAG: hypothetical protein K4305_11320 [Chlorobium sp.]
MQYLISGILVYSLLMAIHYAFTPGKKAKRALLLHITTALLATLLLLL